MEIPLEQLKIVQNVVRGYVHGIESEPNLSNSEKKQRVICEASFLLEEMRYEIPPFVLGTAVESSVKTMKSLARLSQA